MPDKPGTAKIAKIIGRKKVASWKSDLTSSERDSRHEYAVRNGDRSRFTLSESFKTFSHKFTTVVGKSGWEYNELGICSVGAP